MATNGRKEGQTDDTKSEDCPTKVGSDHDSQSNCRLQIRYV